MIRALLHRCRMITPALLLSLSVAASDQVTALLSAAQTAMAEKHYVYPASGSAMALYHDVLTLEPDNPQAQRGLEQIVEHFLDQAREATDQQRYIKAQGMVSRARMVDPENPNIEPIARELRLLEQATRHKVTLDWRKVSARSSKLAPQLHKLGGLARQPDCRAIISVSSDAEGRWIYQQMSQAPGDQRIAAQIRIESPAAVEVLCLVTDNGD